MRGGEYYMGVIHREQERQDKMSSIFKCEAEGDVVYFQARDLEDAKAQLKQKMGDIPESLLKWTKVDMLPEGEEFM